MITTIKDNNNNPDNEEFPNQEESIRKLEDIIKKRFGNDNAGNFFIYKEGDYFKFEPVNHNYDFPYHFLYHF